MLCIWRVLYHCAYTYSCSYIYSIQGFDTSWVISTTNDISINDFYFQSKMVLPNLQNQNNLHMYWFCEWHPLQWVIWEAYKKMTRAILYYKCTYFLERLFTFFFFLMLSRNSNPADSKSRFNPCLTPEVTAINHLLDVLPDISVFYAWCLSSYFDKVSDSKQ